MLVSSWPRPKSSQRVARALLSLPLTEPPCKAVDGLNRPLATDPFRERGQVGETEGQKGETLVGIALVQQDQPVHKLGEACRDDVVGAVQEGLDVFKAADAGRGLARLKDAVTVDGLDRQLVRP